MSKLKMCQTIIVTIFVVALFTPNSSYCENHENIGEKDWSKIWSNFFPEKDEIAMLNKNELLTGLKKSTSGMLSGSVSTSSSEVLKGIKLSQEFERYSRFNWRDELMTGQIFFEEESEMLDVYRALVFIPHLAANAPESFVNFMSEESEVIPPRKSHVIIAWVLLERNYETIFEMEGDSIWENTQDEWAKMLISPNPIFRLIATRYLPAYTKKTELLNAYGNILIEEDISLIQYEALMGIKQTGSPEAIEFIDSYLARDDLVSDDGSLGYLDGKIDIINLAGELSNKLSIEHQLKGEGIAQYEIVTRNAKYKVVEVNLEKLDLSFVTKSISGKPIKTFEDLNSFFTNQQKDILFAANGGIFNKKYKPMGLYVENGKILSDIDLKDGEGNFYLKPNGVFAIQGGKASILDSRDCEDVTLAFDWALQSGPLLFFRNGVINEAFRYKSQNKFLRSGVGIISPTHIAFVLSVDTVNFAEFSLFFIADLGCVSALYLDGTISQFQWQQQVPTSKREYGNFIVVTR